MGKATKFNSNWWLSRFSQEELQLFSKLKNLCTKAKLRSNKEFDSEVNWEYLFDLWDQQSGLCAYSGLPLSTETNHPHTVSLDRIDSNIGYLRGNLQLVSWSVNKMKQDLNEELFLDLCYRITTNKT